MKLLRSFLLVILLLSLAPSAGAVTFDLADPG